jgi:hypothetical protein
MSFLGLIRGWSSKDNLAKPIRIDSATNTIQTIEYEHHEVHAGSSFHCSDVQNVNATTKYWMITTPNTTKWAHMMFDVTATGEMSVTVTEGADRTGTTALTCVNHDRNSDTTGTLVIHRDYSSGTTNGAVILFTERAGATGVAGRPVSTGEGKHSREYILKQNTKYILAITTYADVFVSLELDWYEHTNVV